MEDPDLGAEKARRPAGRSSMMSGEHEPATGHRAADCCHCQDPSTEPGPFPLHSIPLWPAGRPPPHSGKAKQSRHSCPLRGSPHAPSPTRAAAPRTRNPLSPHPVPRHRQSLPTWRRTLQGQWTRGGEDSTHDAASLFQSNHESDAHSMNKAPTGESFEDTTTPSLLHVHANQRAIFQPHTCHYDRKLLQ